MTATKIIEFARYRLGDTDSTGWSDKRLVDLVDAAQKDFCRRSGIHKKVTYIGVTNYKSIYTLPIDSHQITRVEYDNKPVPIYSREDWDNVLGKPAISAIKSDLNMETIEVKPPFMELNIPNRFVKGTSIGTVILRNPLGVTSSAVGGKVPISPTLGSLGHIIGHQDKQADATYGDVSSVFIPNKASSILSTSSKVTGVTVGASVTNNKSAYGFTTSVGTVGIDGFGIVTDAFLEKEYLTVYYNAVPDTIKTKYASLIIDNTWEMAIIHYVTGMARQDDNDEGNYQLGNAELAKYEALVDRAKKDSARSFATQVDMSRITIYRRF